VAHVPLTAGCTLVDTHRGAVSPGQRPRTRRRLVARCIAFLRLSSRRRVRVWTSAQRRARSTSSVAMAAGPEHDQPDERHSEHKDSECTHRYSIDLSVTSDDRSWSSEHPLSLHEVARMTFSLVRSVQTKPPFDNYFDSMDMVTVPLPSNWTLAATSQFAEEAGTFNARTPGSFSVTFPSSASLRLNSCCTRSTIAPNQSTKGTMRPSIQFLTDS
jgi:hypothetical protein